MDSCVRKHYLGGRDVHFENTIERCTNMCGMMSMPLFNRKKFF